MGNEVSSDDEKSNVSKELGDGKRYVAGLSKQQIQRVKECWPYACKQGDLEPASSLFKAAVAEEPQLKKIFGFYDDPRQASMKESVHTEKLNKYLKEIFNRLEDEEALDRLAFDLGKRHFYKAKQAGFNQKYWDVFAQAMAESTTKWAPKNHRNQKTQEAWTIIVLHIIEKMKEGFIAEHKRSVNISAHDDIGSSKKQ